MLSLASPHKMNGFRSEKRGSPKITPSLSRQSEVPLCASYSHGPQENAKPQKRGTPLLVLDSITPL